MNKFFFMLLLIATGVLLYFLAPVLTPFLFGALIAYLVQPLVRRLVKWGLPHTAAVLIIFLSLILVIVLLVVLVVPLIQQQFDKLIAALPGMLLWLQDHVLPVLKEHFGVENRLDVDTLKNNLSGNLTSASGALGWVFKTLLHSGLAITEIFMHLLLVPVVTFYLLYDWDRIIANIRNILPRKYKKTIVDLFSECNAVLSAFFRGQLMVMLSLGVIYSIGLTLAGLQFGLAIGLIAGLLNIVPYLGVTVGLVVSSIAAYVQFGAFSHVLIVWLVFVIGQTCDGMFLTPRLVGHRIGLHPVAVIFAILAGGKLFGFFGVLLALPVAAVTVTVIRFFIHNYRTQTSS